MEFVERTVPLEGGEIGIVAWPAPRAGAPVLHFAHGTGLCGRAYQRLLAPLAARFEVVAWDARGHGRTTLPADPATLVDWRPYVEDLAALIARVSPGRPAFLMGHSLGGITSLEMAAARPDLAAAVLVLEPPLVPESEIEWLEGLRAKGETRPIETQMQERAGRRRAHFPDRATAAESWRGKGAFATWPDAWLDDFVAGGLLPDDERGGFRLACPPAWEGKTYHAVSTNFWRSLARLERPATIMHGDRNSPVSAESVASIDRIGRARRVPVPGATHFLPVEFPDLVRAEAMRLADEAGL